MLCVAALDITRGGLETKSWDIEWLISFFLKPISWIFDNKILVIVNQVSGYRGSSKYVCVLQKT